MHLRYQTRIIVHIVLLYCLHVVGTIHHFACKHVQWQWLLHVGRHVDNKASGLWICKVTTIWFSRGCWDKGVGTGQITSTSYNILLTEEYSTEGFKITLLPNTVSKKYSHRKDFKPLLKAQTKPPLSDTAGVPVNSAGQNQMSAPMYAVLVNHCRQRLVCQREIFSVIADGLGNLQMLLQASLASGQDPTGSVQPLCIPHHEETI